MARKTPAVPDEGLGKLPSFTVAPSITATHRIQHLASRYALPIEIAAIVAGLYFTEAR